MNILRQVQDVLFDICDLIDSGQVNGFKLYGYPDFETLREFLEYQKTKMQSIEEGLEQVSDETRSYGPQGARHE